MFQGLSKHCDQYGPTAAMNFATQMLNDPTWARKTNDDRSLIFALKPQSAKAKPHANSHGSTGLGANSGPTG